MGLNINATKTNTMCINTPKPAEIELNGIPVDEVDQFTYLGSIVSKDSGTTKDIQSRLRKACQAFSMLRPIWRSSEYSLKTKIKLYTSNVKSVLLYGAECWRTTKEDMNKLSSFQNNCLRQICKIFWPNKISNSNLHKMTGVKDIVDEIKQRRWRWFGHIMRKPANTIAKTALTWTPEGKRNRGRPKETWRRTITRELKEANISWKEAEKMSQDRSGW